LRAQNFWKIFLTGDLLYLGASVGLFWVFVVRYDLGLVGVSLVKFALEFVNLVWMACSWARLGNTTSFGKETLSQIYCTKEILGHQADILRPRMARLPRVRNPNYPLRNLWRLQHHPGVGDPPNYHQTASDRPTLPIRDPPGLNRAEPLGQAIPQGQTDRRMGCNHQLYTLHDSSSPYRDFQKRNYSLLHTLHPTTFTMHRFSLSVRNQYHDLFIYWAIRCLHTKFTGLGMLSKQRIHFNTRNSQQCRAYHFIDKFRILVFRFGYLQHNDRLLLHRWGWVCRVWTWNFLLY
jgi:hypothetical protein